MITLLFGFLTAVLYLQGEGASMCMAPDEETMSAMTEIPEVRPNHVIGCLFSFKLCLTIHLAAGNDKNIVKERSR